VQKIYDMEYRFLLNGTAVRNVSDDGSCIPIRYKENIPPEKCNANAMGKKIRVGINQ